MILKPALASCTLIATLIATLLSLPAAADASFERCLGELRSEAQTRGIKLETFDALTRTLEPDGSVLGLLDYQPEFRTPIWDYLAGLVDDERIADGHAMTEKWAATLQQIETQYGVDRATIVAVWGVESDFGRNFGKRPLLTSLSTLSCFGRRQSFFRGEFFTTLKIIENGDVDAARLTGSWAGAFGHTQFMPSTFARVAVDFDGDGRRDLVDSIPDALASTANFLAKAGWVSGQPWGHEIKLPGDFDFSLAGRHNKRSIAEWVRLGVRRIDGVPLEASTAPAAVLLPAGEGGPTFLVQRNFDALYSYNTAETYALAIAHLSDRLRGGGAFVRPWPTDDPGLSRAERREVQALLVRLGYAVGEIDGLIGKTSREAIQDVQKANGLEPDGRAGRYMLEVLRRLAGTAAGGDS
ncbi:lytic murein transglycosylase [Aromatoleum petrolei]|uniref:Lytic murein transglycosylase n=1 Tax=Aromatoleum petrolei TaxID=76116 RepID=A0ABX1ML97_9RHOO|nr:lytic murein transglycosylase [Aromatoleum petrolei]NMF88742.1 lytic murein transglycosylase [Aromatoleum petrolei]QTQ37834.1 putative lytic murein transglycosylase [Aromatoleum petrolei]